MGDVIKNKVGYCFFFQGILKGISGCFRGWWSINYSVLTIFVGCWILFQDVFPVLGMIIMSRHYASNAAKLLLKIILKSKGLLLEVRMTVRSLLSLCFSPLLTSPNNVGNRFFASAVGKSMMRKTWVWTFWYFLIKMILSTRFGGPLPIGLFCARLCRPWCQKACQTRQLGTSNSKGQVAGDIFRQTQRGKQMRCPQSISMHKDLGSIVSSQLS